MRTVTITKTYYEFRELSEGIKEKALEHIREWYLNSRSADDFADFVLENLKEAYGFVESELNVQFSLASCQGDGLNIYGKLHLSEAYEHVKEQFTVKEQKFLVWALTGYKPVYDMRENRYYDYCIADQYDFCSGLIDAMECDNTRGIQYDTLAKFEKAIQKLFTGLCSNFEEDGYSFFYEVDADTLIDWAYNFAFDEAGNIAG